MRREFAFALLAFLAAPFAIAQQAAPPAPPSPITAQPAAETIFYAGPGVTAPELIPPVVSVSSPKHCIEYDGVVKLSAVVDVNGAPRSVNILSSDFRVRDFAVGFLAAQRFRPGTYNGVPVPVAIEATLGLQNCLQRAKGVNGSETYDVTLRSHPVIAIDILAQPQATLTKLNSQDIKSTTSEPGAIPGVYKIGANISAPVPLNSIEAEYSDYARKERIEGVCLLSAIVDVNGLPQNIHVIRSLEPSLDANAMDAVKQYRFKPAMKDGKKPVPVQITVEVQFILVKRKQF